MRLSLSIVILWSTLLGACGSKQVSQEELDRKPPPIPSPSYSLDGMPYVLRFEQGVERSYDIAQYAKVERGNPVVTVRNLPDGAVFDGRILSWKPSCAKDPEFYQNGIGIHAVMFTLRSDANNADFIEHDAGLVVNEFNDYHGQLSCEKEHP